MGALHIDAKKLGAEGLRLELESQHGGINVIKLEPSGGVTGTYEQDAKTIRLRSIRGETLALGALYWELAEGKIELDGPGVLRRAEIDAAIAIGPAKRERPNPFVGVIRAGSLSVSLAIDLPSASVRIEELELSDAELHVDPKGHIAVRAEAATAGTVEVEVGPSSFTARGVRLGEGLRFSGGSFHLPSFAVDELGVGLSDLAALRAERAERAKEEGTQEKEGTTGKEGSEVEESAKAEPGAGAAAEKPPLDLPFLDDLDGHINLDVVTDVTIPILGRRRATHKFRIAVHEGVIDFRALEKNLAFLEDLVINLKLREDRLVLEKDVPFIPFDRKPLVYWTLDARAEALARKERVPLRSFLRPEIPEKRKKEAQADIQKRGRGVDFRRLDIHNLNVSLRVGGPSAIGVAGGSIRLGGHDEPAIGELEVKGQLAHEAQTGGGPGELTLIAREVHAGLEQIAAGDYRLEAGLLEVAAIERATLEMDGLSPRTFHAKVAGLELSGIKLFPAPAPSTPPEPE